MRLNSLLILFSVILGFTGDYSGSGEVYLLMPAGFAFSIWLVIYAGALRFSVHAWRGEFRELGLLPGISFFLSGLWSRIGALGHHSLSIVLALTTLFLSLRNVQAWYARREDRSSKEYLFWPFVLYAGWVTVATLVWGNQLAVAAGFAAANTLPVAYGAATLALLLALKSPRHWSWGYSGAIAWGLFWIALARAESYPLFAGLCFTYALVAWRTAVHKC